MKIINYSPDSPTLTGTLNHTEKKIIDAEFHKAKPGDDLEIEMLDKKGFIEEKKIIDAIQKSQVDESGKGDYVIGDVKQFKKELGLK